MERGYRQSRLCGTLLWRAGPDRPAHRLLSRPGYKALDPSCGGWRRIRSSAVLAAGVRRQVFLPYLESAAPAAVTFYVRSTKPAADLFTTLRRVVAKLDSSVPVYELKTLDEQLEETLSTERLIAFLSTAFGLLATALAALGLYGVMAFLVTRRAGEIGLRMALGAPRSGVLWLVLREMLILLGGGLLVGVRSAYILSQYVSSQLFGVTPTDVWTGVAAIALLGLIVLFSGLVPARRASAIDPMTALRCE